MFADLDMPDTDETVSRSFLTNEITRFGRVLSVTLAPYGALDGEGRRHRGSFTMSPSSAVWMTHAVSLWQTCRTELRTPLTNIRSYTETLLDAAGRAAA